MFLQNNGEISQLPTVVVERIVPDIRKVPLLIAKLLAEQLISGMVAAEGKAPFFLGGILGGVVDNTVGGALSHLFNLSGINRAMPANVEPFKLGKAVEGRNVPECKVIADIEMPEILEICKGSKVVKP